MTYLLDANVLIARSHFDHIFYGAARSWTAKNPEFALCPITEGALVRYVVRERDQRAAKELLSTIEALPGYEFWPDEISYRSINLAMVAGHKQVTDAYLVGLARVRGCRLATFDTALATLYPDATLVPVEA